MLIPLGYGKEVCMYPKIITWKISLSLIGHPFSIQETGCLRIDCVTTVYVRLWFLIRTSSFYEENICKCKVLAFWLYCLVYFILHYWIKLYLQYFTRQSKYFKINSIMSGGRKLFTLEINRSQRTKRENIKQNAWHKIQCHLSQLRGDKLIKGLKSPACEHRQNW